MARRRSGRSGCPAGVRCSRQAGWVMSSVDITLLWHGRTQTPIPSFPSPAGHAHAARRRWLIGNKECRRQRLIRVHAVFFEIGHALAGEETVVDQEIPGELACRLRKYAIDGVGHDLASWQHAN